MCWIIRTDWKPCTTLAHGEMELFALTLTLINIQLIVRIRIGKKCSLSEECTSSKYKIYSDVFLTSVH